MQDYLKFCYEKTIKISKAVDGRTAAIAYKDKYWEKGHVLKIYFINGTDYQKNNMISVIEEILSPLSLDVEYVSIAQESEIRISFNYGWGSYSYLGTDALFIPKTEETLNIGWDGKDVMRHEFCHALNLAHEHQNPKGGIVWDEQQVIKDLSGPPNYWTVEQIKYNVFDKISLTQADATDFDPDSVMLYYFPNTWTIGDFQTNDNPILSEIDKAFLLEKYAIEEVDTVAPVLTVVGEQYLTLEYNQPYIERGARAVDNKDGDITGLVIIDGEIDSTAPGLQYITYRVKDYSGNKAEAKRTVLVKEKSTNDGCLPSFLSGLFSSKSRLSKLTEDQLLFIASELGVQAKKEDLKSDTVNKLWSIISVVVR